MKYRHEERLASYLGRRMVQQVIGGAPTTESMADRPYDLIVPIPIHRDRLRERGFNQSLLLAREVGKTLEIKVDPFVMVKKRPTPPQAVLKGDERRKNLRNAFDVSFPEKIKDKKVLLIDDVYTTGTTIEVASKKLLEEGASEVKALVVARAE
jgi:ComF family protein